jgi:hypothetical protein
MKAKTLDKKFDSGGDVIKYLDLQKAARPGQEQLFPIGWLTRWIRKPVDWG